MGDESNSPKGGGKQRQRQYVHDVSHLTYLFARFRTPSHFLVQYQGTLLYPQSIATRAVPPLKLSKPWALVYPIGLLEPHY